MLTVLLLIVGCGQGTSPGMTVEETTPAGTDVETDVAGEREKDPDPQFH